MTETNKQIRAQTSNKKISLGLKFAWGIGGFADFFMANTIMILVMPIYNIGLGVSAGLVGLALGFLPLPRFSFLTLKVESSCV